MALTVAAVAVRDGPRTTDPAALLVDAWIRYRALIVAMAAVAALALAAGYGWGDRLPGLVLAAWGLTVGLVAALLTRAAELAGSGQSMPAVAIGLATSGLSVLNLTGLDGRPGLFGFIAGISFGAWLLSLRPEYEAGGWAEIGAAIGAALASTTFFGQVGLGKGAAYSGIALGSAAVVGVLGARFAAPILRFRQEDTYARRGAGIILAAALLLLLNSLLAKRFFFVGDTWGILAGAIGAAFVVSWLLPDRPGQNPLRFLIAAVVWIALATIAFGLRRGYGMSLTMVGAVTMLAVLGNRRAILSLGPAMLIVCFRMFREANPASYQALDIGQHYAVIGLLLGAILPLLPIEWSRVPGALSTVKTAVAALIWLILAVAVLPAAGIFLAAKGLVGFAIGLGFAPIVEGLRGQASLLSLNLGTALASATVLTVGWLGDNLEKAREDKLGLLYWVAAGILLAGLVIAGLTPRTELHESAA